MEEIKTDGGITNSEIISEISKTADNRLVKGGPFRKGDTRINRKGRPKLGLAIAELSRSYLKEPVSDDNPDYLWENKILEELRKLAASGNLQAMEMLLSRAYGKIPENIKINQEEEVGPDFTTLTPEEFDIMNKLITKATYGPDSEEYQELINPKIWDLEPDDEEGE
jgi:hypothetical protein